MILSINFSIRTAVLLLAILLCFSSAAAQNDAAVEAAADKPIGSTERLKIAVYPVSNLSGSTAPLAAITLQMIEELKESNATLIEGDVLDSVLTKHRVRYLGGLDQSTAQAMRQDAGADCVLITSLELYSEVIPPKIALTSRLVSTGSETEILWIDGIGLAGDDAPGLLAHGLVEDPRVLSRRAVHRLAQSLRIFLSGQAKRVDSRTPKKKFGPEVVYRNAVFAADKTYRVAVVPFFNPSARSFAGEILALHFVRQLWALENFKVIEPGVVRHQLLRSRIIMDSGVSLADADLIAHELNADLILNGKVIDYQDYRGYGGIAKVDFSAQLIERQSREVVWSVKSHHQGDDGVFFFDWGRVNTAYAMASQMVQLAVQDLGE
jgi:TolB-like protein